MTATAAAQRLPPLMTVDDFIEWPGDGSGRRYELVDGVLRAMAPASDAHGTIHANLAALLTNHLRATRPGCRVVMAPGVQPRVRADWNFRIPDLGVTCTPNRRGDVMMPDTLLLIEVLSPGNEQDTWDNIRNYATVPSVRELLVVRSTRVEAELLRREPDGNWPANPEKIGPGDQVALASIGLTFPLRAAYAGTWLVEAGE